MTPHAVAHAVGIAVDWEDASGRPQRVGDAALEAVLAALGYPADSGGAIAGSLERAAEEARALPALLTVDAGAPLALPDALHAQGGVDLVAEDGYEVRWPVEHGRLAPIDTPGYYRLRAGGRDVALAVAPPGCLPIEAVSDRRLWGPSVQIPALRNGSPSGFGHFGHLARAAARFAGGGADAVAISPVHALYPGDGSRFSPYAPSSRQFLNTALADPQAAGLPPLPPGREPPLIDWAQAVPEQARFLAHIFRELGPERRAEVMAWASGRGEALRRHALFEALYVRFVATGVHGWQGWPREYHDPAGEAARRFAEENPEAIAVHLFAQWLARQGLEQAQVNAKEAGMAIGLIADLAVGVDPGGSDAWGMSDALLRGLTIGAPPDPLGPTGQNWGLTTFSPGGLRRSGFAPWLAMLRAALETCGGLRIDHAFGLRRLWVVPDGASALEGAYLSYPFEDLLRLLALESQRARALIVAEDLGTVPPGFRDAITRKAMLGMRVLWFERDHHDHFRSPRHYDETSVAMTGTHDTATVAGWWQGRDIDWNWKLGRVPEGRSRHDDEAHRAFEKARLWAAIGHGAPEPAPDDTAPVVDAAVRHIAASDARLAIFPLEDLLGLEEQPNLPGTLDEHPNWRRRLPGPLDELLDEPAVARRIATLDGARKERKP